MFQQGQKAEENHTGPKAKLKCLRYLKYIFKKGNVFYNVNPKKI